MFFLNLSLPEFIAILGSLSGVVVALYLLDRMRKKHIVPTLRFFAASERPPVLKHRRKLQQPWSLLLQLLSLLLLLLALAQLRFGSAVRSSRDHVLILDTSAWMAARSGQGRLIDQTRAAARNYVKMLPSADRVMVIRADVLATPVTLFESDRQKVQTAIDQTQPGSAPLNIQQALEYAQQAQRLHAQRPGEIVFAGAGRIAGEEAPLFQAPSNLRFIPVAGPTEHVGLRKMAVRRSLTDAETWDIFVAVKNYGARDRSVPMGLQFGGAAVGTRRFDLKPGMEDTAVFHFKTRAAGWLEARLLIQDSFPQDERAILELPARSSITVRVYSSEPELLKPIFTSIPGVQATYQSPSAYDPAVKDGIVLFDRFAPATVPAADSIWIQPPAGKSPIEIRSTEKSVKLARWNANHSLASGLRAKDLEFNNAEVFKTQSGDIAVAEAAIGALIVARPGKPKTVVFGFHPEQSGMRYEVSTPLLFANILRWITPDIFRSWELTAGTIGTVDVPIDTDADPSTFKVTTEEGKRLPFTMEGRNLRFFSGAPGIVRVQFGDRELVYSLTLPQPGDVVWKPVSAKMGLPPRAPAEPSARDIWQWLAVLGGLGLLADWIIFGRMQRGLAAAAHTIHRTPWRKAS